MNLTLEPPDSKMVRGLRQLPLTQVLTETMTPPNSGSKGLRRKGLQRTSLSGASHCTKHDACVWAHSHLVRPGQSFSLLESSVSWAPWASGMRKGSHSKAAHWLVLPILAHFHLRQRVLLLGAAPGSCECPVLVKP